MFICFGLPKSGTTFLQRILDSHPDVSCPSEQDFDFLLQRLQGCISDYNNVLALINSRIGAPPLRLIQSDDFSAISGAIIKEVILSLANGKKIAGANDNGAVRNLPFFDTAFDNLKTICIFRHPLDRAVSAWHHNIHLSEIENNPKHREIMMDAGGFDGWILQAAEIFEQHVQDYFAFSDQPRDALAIRYEDLVDDRRGQIELVFRFLGANTEQLVLDPIFQKTSFGRMRAESTKPSFFRKGVYGHWQEEVCSITAQKAMLVASSSLKRLGYQP
jgi:hypothetical protein